MSDSVLTQILLRLDTIDQRFDTIDRRLGTIDQRLDTIDQRLDRGDRRFDNMEREQTRLRTDLMDQMERVLAGMQLVKDDVTVAMAYATRADAGADANATIQRSLQSQLGQLRTRVERLEGRQGGTG